MNAYRPNQYVPPPPANPSYNSTAPLPTGMWQSAGGAYTANPQANETTSYNLNNLIAGNSQYMQQAAATANANSAARGLGNSSYASGNAQAAAIAAAMPIAQADAGVYANSALANQTALNQTNIANNQNLTSMHNAGTAAGASMYGSLMNFNANKYGQDQQTLRQGNQDTWQGGQNVLNDQYAQVLQQRAGDIANYNSAQSWQRNLYGGIMQSAVNTTLSDPANYNNPQAALGMISGYSNYAGNMIGQYLNGSGNGTGSP